MKIEDCVLLHIDDTTNTKQMSGTLNVKSVIPKHSFKYLPCVIKHFVHLIEFEILSPHNRGLQTILFCKLRVEIESSIEYETEPNTIYSVCLTFVAHISPSLSILLYSALHTLNVYCDISISFTNRRAVVHIGCALFIFYKRKQNNHPNLSG